jgi:hypothetical protein
MGKHTTQLNRQADEAWAQILRSPIASVYLREVYQLANEIVEEIESAQVLMGQPPGPGVGTIVVDHDLNRKLMRAMGAAARLRALCVQRGRGRQPELQYKIHLRRSAWITDLLTGIDLDPLGSAHVRNTIEHFDEYLDATALDAASGSMTMPAFLPVDLALSNRMLLNQFGLGGKSPNVYFLRAYIGGEEVFINCGHEMDIAAARNCSELVRTRISEILGSQLDAEGSPMVVLTSESFAD